MQIFRKRFCSRDNRFRKLDRHARIVRRSREVDTVRHRQTREIIPRVPRFFEVYFQRYNCKNSLILYCLLIFSCRIYLVFIK